MSLLFWLLLASVCIGVLVTIWFMVDTRHAYARISGHSIIFPSPLGDIEFKREGTGVPVLVIHGSGGGYDQGEIIATTILDERFDWIAPSRFGYLCSTFRHGATFEDQAEAYACLLSHLGLQRVAVLALSHGGPSALLFAARYPERVSSLTLVSCGVASSSEAIQAQADQKGDVLTIIFKFEILYWLVKTFLRKQLMSLMGVSDRVIETLTIEQRRLVDQVIDGMAPVVPRYGGVVFDNKAMMPNERVGTIQVPTLILHAADDMLQLFHNAEYAATHIPGSRLVSFKRGGHLLLAVEQSAIQAEVRRFILAHAGDHVDGY
ncbi:MAG: alpha/beta hydrolase [Nitrospira sp.]|nr:alpha/beta hydrolase [Nitrospira sp.]MDH4304228.1 alpha/beta hydrolase [Nitrospira sp.]